MPTVVNSDLKKGDKVKAHGYEGTVTSVYIPPTKDEVGMYEVRLPGGIVCISGRDIDRI